MPDKQKKRQRDQIPLSRIAIEWGRIGLSGFGGPPAHFTQFRRLCVEDNAWLSSAEFEDIIASANLLPGPVSTQVGIYCAWRVRGFLGGIVGGLFFILPGLLIILLLAALLLSKNPPIIALGAAAGAGAAVPAVALNAAVLLFPASRARLDKGASERLRWIGYALLGAIVTIWLSRYLVLVLLASGLIEVILNMRKPAVWGISAGIHKTVFAAGSLAGLAWTAFKVGALSYGGGFVIVPLMQADAVNVHHWMTSENFLTAVALGQMTPGPLVRTVAVVGYAAAGISGGIFAVTIAFAPSFIIILAGAKHFDRIRKNRRAKDFLKGAGPATIGAIAGSAIPLALSIRHVWQVYLLAGAAIWLLVAKKSVVGTLLLALSAGAILAAFGFPV